MTDIVLSGNLTGDVLNGVSSQPDTEGATGNKVEWTEIEEIPVGCSIPLPSPPAASDQTTAGGEEGSAAPTGATAGNDAAVGGDESAEPTDARTTNEPDTTTRNGMEPWAWILSLVGFVVVAGVLLARRRASHRRTV